MIGPALFPTREGMFTVLIYCCLFLLLEIFPPSSASSSFRYLEILNNKGFEELKKTALHDHETITDVANNVDDDDDDVEELYFTQRLDHYDPTNVGTFQQRYFVSNRYANPKSSKARTPSFVFLCVGGEGAEMTKSVLVDSVHCTGDMLELADHLYKHYDGISIVVMAIEHRYYGNSIPFSSASAPSPAQLTIAHLKYLSSRQALEDLAHFVQTKSQDISASSSDINSDIDLKWVTFGGSYPGFLAAQARFKYPHLVYASVSNSAPLDLKVDFPQYKEKVGWDLKYSKIGGSNLCYGIVKEGHLQAISLLEENSTKLATMFNVCNPQTALNNKRNQGMLLGDGLINIPAQSNDPACGDEDDKDDSLCDVRRLCDYMTRKFVASKVDINNMNPSNNDDRRTELEILADVAVNKQQQTRRLGGVNATAPAENGCMTVDWQETLLELAKPVADSYGIRSWLWQTCTEFGFYQTCEEDCPYASYYHLIDMDLEVCSFAYNITNVYENVQSSIDFYGGLDINGGSRVLSVNGDVDPWSMLGLTEAPKYSLPAEMVKGASHHFWTHKVKDTDSVEIQQVREYIYSVVGEWLNLKDDGSTEGSRFLWRKQQSSAPYHSWQ